MAKFKLSIIGLNGMMKKVQAMPDRIVVQVDEAIDLNLREMVLHAQQDAPADHANLKRLITRKKIKPLLWEMVSQASYSVFMEFGTKGNYRPIAGVSPGKFKSTATEGGKGFYDSILEWVKRKGITGTYSVKTRKRTGNAIDRQIEDEQVAFAIYLSIMRHGVKAHPFFFKQVTRQEPILKKDIDDRLKRVA